MLLTKKNVLAVKRFMIFAVFLQAFLLMQSKDATANMGESMINPLLKVGLWSRAETVQNITDQNIFQYMNGAGEVYLGYRFDYLDVYKYKGAGLPEILVEIYWMKSSDDAFGLLSMDWGGEPVIFNESLDSQPSPAIAPASRALYGAGLLRIWSENVYVRILVEHETAESKKVVLSLGKAITRNRIVTPQPKLLNLLSSYVNPGWKLRSDRIAYFRSYLVLNTIYFLSFKNILKLNLSTEAVFAPYERTTDQKDNRRVQFLLIKYETAAQAQSALASFCRTYLEENNKKTVSGMMVDTPLFYQIEEGWVGFRLTGRYLSLVLNSQEKSEGLLILNQIQSNIPKMEIDDGN